MKVEVIRLFNSVARDVTLDPFTTSYCIRRLKSEGIQFWSVTLPKLSKSVLRSLELGYFDRPTCFAWKGKSLRYFRSFLNRIFCVSSGKVLDSVDPVALWQLRQICEYAYKLSLDFDDESLRRAESNFKKVDTELGAFSFSAPWVESLRKDFETHFSSISAATVTDLYKSARPRSGPGTFSCTRKYESTQGRNWYERRRFDYSNDPRFANLGGLTKPYPRAKAPAVCKIDPNYSEVLFVPKDSRGPRVIVREPYSLLRQQMAFNSFLASGLERVTHKRINFQDQLVNRELACISSRDRQYATLDLKDASDRVSYYIVRHIFRHSPALRYFISRRTPIAKLPSGEFVKLNKLSGMGSGLTFPVMSLLIYLSVCRSVVDNTGLAYKTVKENVYIYGDDLIIPVKYVPFARLGLEKSGLLVNEDKSYCRSFFRESCGGDYYLGQDISPVRLKLSNCNLSIDGLELKVSGNQSFLQVERHCRELIKNGHLLTAEYFYSLLEKAMGKLPVVSGESPILGRYSLIPHNYECDETGAYALVRCRLPVPRYTEFDGDPSLYFEELFLRSKRVASYRDWMYPTEGSTFSVVAVPRAIRYRSISVSSFRLMG